MKTVIKLAKQSLDNYKVEQCLLMRTSEMEICIEICNNIISDPLNNSYEIISDKIYQKINTRFDGNDNWHCMTFAETGGESLVNAYKYIRILFDKLVIEIFTSRHNNKNTVPNILYHYTDTSGAQGIGQNGRILKGSRIGAFDAGVYLTSLDPRIHTINEILENNYGWNKEVRDDNKADYYAIIYTNKLNANKLIKVETPQHQDIYRYNDTINISDRFIMENVLTMKSVVQLARRKLDDYIVHQILNMNQPTKSRCIALAKIAIRDNDTYEEISSEIFYKLNTKNESKRWHCITFARSGGESLVKSESFIRLLFSRLVVEIFCAGYV
ncbi:uncharacterized protein LOC128952340 [Oppia nitens]|uniref:uncharacterized protein LOC128952340 n=1 Tax=Oppia nitens TaxID=1686743 RepID=UPI0023DCCB7F|nr:uncharacterized protein LOC128952340 [Oppia nitens]